MSTRKVKKSKYFTKIQIIFMKYKSKTLQEQGRENTKILYILWQVVWRARKKKEKEV